MARRSSEPGSDYERWLRALGKRIADRRSELGWTQAQAAVACGLDFKFYQDLEYGRRPCSTRTLFGVAVALRTTVQDLAPTDEHAPDRALSRVAETRRQPYEPEPSADPDEPGGPGDDDSSVN